MNPAKLVLKPRPPLPPPPSLTRTVNLYTKRTWDPLNKSRAPIRTIGWEERPVRVANTVTWLIEHAKKEGLTPGKDGYVRVQELLKHPNLLNLDFPTIEKAVKAFRHPYLRLTFAPRSTPLEPNATQAGCWWIGIQKQQKYTKRTWEDYADRRIIDPKIASGMVYQISPRDWPEISTRGIPRGQSPRLAFDNSFMIPSHYEGDHTFIRVDSTKVHASHPLYNTRTINRRAGNKPKDTFTTPAPKILPNMFEAVMRVATERYPLMLRGPTIKEKQRQFNKRIGDPHIMNVMQSGVNALRKYGFAGVVEQSGLEAGLVGRQKKASAEQTMNDEERHYQRSR